MKVDAKAKSLYVNGRLFYTKHGAAELLGLSAQGVLREAAAGRLAYFEHPACRLFSADDLDAWVEKRSRGARGVRQ